MPKITSLEQLARLKVELVMQRNREAERGVIRVSVGTASCGIAAGAREVFDELSRYVEAQGLDDVLVMETGCIGLCGHEPIVEVTIGDAPKVSYGRVDRRAAKRILQEHILDGKVVAEYVIDTTPFPTI